MTGVEWFISNVTAHPTADCTAQQLREQRAYVERVVGSIGRECGSANMNQTA